MPNGPLPPAGQSMALRVNRVHYPVTVLGYGTRLGIWVQGCPLACRGCIAQDTWAAGEGIEMSVPGLAQIWRQAAQQGAEGVTISGGEPLAQPAAVGALLGEIASTRDELRNLGSAPGGPPLPREFDILVYTGYELAELTPAQHLAVRDTDVLITGRYDITAPTGLLWRGSANQRMLLRTPLGHRRYAPVLEEVPEKAPLQVSVDADGIWLIGVPRAGDLSRLERTLRQRGVPVDSVSWRGQRNRDQLE